MMCQRLKAIHHFKVMKIIIIMMWNVICLPLQCIETLFILWTAWSIELDTSYKFLILFIVYNKPVIIFQTLNQSYDIGKIVCWPAKNRKDLQNCIGIKSEGLYTNDDLLYQLNKLILPLPQIACSLRLFISLEKTIYYTHFQGKVIYFE